LDSCHCSICRRWGGGPALAVEASGGVKFKNESAISTFSSSDWAERGFCSNCGTHLYYKLKDNKFWSAPLCLLDNQSELKFMTQIFVDHKPENYEFTNKTKMMTEADVLQAFGATE